MTLPTSIKIKFALTILMAILAVRASAQIVMKGVVQNDKGAVMEGAYISVEGSSVATLTDFDGNFTITIPERYADSTLVIDYAGYISETRPVREGTYSIVLRNKEAQAIDEIHVSTQKRLQRTVEVPIAVSVIDSAKIQQTSLYRIDEMSNFVPGFNAIVHNDHNIVYGIRGVTSNEPESYGQSRISVYMDGVSISRIQTAYMEQYDMERVEVVKGPQGTLFGRGAEMGAVHYIRKKPTDEFGVSLSALYGNYNQRKIVGVLNTPAGDALSNRLSFVYDAHDGFLKNDAGGRLNGRNTIAARNSTTFHFGDRTDFNMTFDIQHDDAPGTSYQCKTQYASNGELITADKSPFTTASLTHGGNDLSLKRNYGGFTGQLDINLGEHFDLNSTSGVRAYRSDETYDIDGSPLRILDGKDWSQGFQVSEELRVNWNFGKKIDGFFGASYFYERAKHGYVFSGDLHYIYPLAVGRNMRTSLSSLPETIIAGIEAQISKWSDQKKKQYGEGLNADEKRDLENLLDAICADFNAMVAERVREQVGVKFSDWFDVIYWDQTPDFFTDTKETVTNVVLQVMDIAIEKYPIVASLVGGSDKGLEGILEDMNVDEAFSGLVPYSNVELDDDHFEDETDYNRTHEASVFADFNWNFVKNFYLTLGVRATYEKLQTGYSSTSMLAPMLGSIIYENTDGVIHWTDKKYKSWVGRAVLNWMMNPTHNLYLSASRGRRPGMIYFNYTPSEIVSLSPEITLSYELGIKGTTKYGHLSYGLAFYYYDWQNFQTLVAGRGQTASGALSYVSDDNGKAYGSGAELSGMYTFNPNVSIFADFAYTGGTFADEDMKGNVQGNSGNMFSMMPRYTFDLGFNWKHNLPGGKTLYFYPSFYTQSKMYFNAANTADFVQHAYVLLNANAGIQWSRGRVSYDVGVYGRNLTNTQYLTDAGNAGEVIGLPTYEVGNPATVYLSLRVGIK